MTKINNFHMLSFEIDQSRLARTASTTSWVELSPPRSFVRYLPSAITRLTAVSRRSANEGNWRCRSIMADERSRATGFAILCSVIFSFPTFPAEAPCSKTAWSAPTFPTFNRKTWWEALKQRSRVSYPGKIQLYGASVARLGSEIKQLTKPFQWQLVALSNDCLLHS